MYSFVGPSGDSDVARRACTWMCAFWRVPGMSTLLILLNVTKCQNELKARLYPIGHIVENVSFPSSARKPFVNL